MKHDFRYFSGRASQYVLPIDSCPFAAIGVTVACLVIMGTFRCGGLTPTVNLKDLQRRTPCWPSWMRTL